MADARKQLGRQGEEFVAKELLRRGWIIRERNYRSVWGEIDLIAECQEAIRCIEVKLRKQQYFHTAEVITPTKQKKIIATAKDYLVRTACIDKVVLFDVALVSYAEQKFVLEYIENAFNQE